MLTTGGGRLAGVDVADDHDVDVHLLLTMTFVSMLLSLRCSRQEPSADRVKLTP